MIGKNTDQCRKILESLEERLDRAADLVQATDEEGLKVIDPARYDETYRLVAEIVAELKREAADDDKDGQTLVESAVYFPAITGANAYFTLDINTAQSRKWHNHLFRAQIDITYGLDQLKSF